MPASQVDLALDANRVASRRADGAIIEPAAAVIGLEPGRSASVVVDRSDGCQRTAGRQDGDVRADRIGGGCRADGGSCRKSPSPAATAPAGQA